jgi:Cys-tRNA(Pro)/Cys-tRNA(Cys) deacylase
VRRSRKDHCPDLKFLAVLSERRGRTEKQEQGMKEQKKEKTNVMRLLDAAGIVYRTAFYEVDEQDLSGVHVAAQLGQDPDSCFKTLVLKGERTGFLVCCIPVAEELDLRKAAKAAGDKKVEMLPMKELLPVTGYIRGGCSPVGMKKRFPVYIEETAMLFEEIAVSAGVRGAQIIVNPETLRQYVSGKFCSLV